MNKLFILSLLGMMFLIPGCAEKGPILLTTTYQLPAESPEKASTAAVAVNPFRDERGKPVSVVGSRTIPDGQSDDLVVRSSVSDAVTSVLKQALMERGITVKNTVGWDLTAEGLQVTSAPVVLGGVIKSLWLESKATSMSTQVHVVVQMRIVAGDTREKKIIRAIDVNSRIQQEMLYSREKMQQALSEAISSALDQLFSDDELKKRFR